MTHKQVSWRRSNQALFLFSLLLIPTYLFSADPGSAAAAAVGGASTGAGAGQDIGQAQALLDLMSGLIDSKIQSAISARGVGESCDSAEGVTGGTGAAVDGKGGKADADDEVVLPVYPAKEIRIQDQILNAAPIEVQHLHNYITDWETGCMGAFFHGEPGAGKTKGALGVFRKAGLAPFVIDPCDVQSGRVTETGTNLVRKLDEITSACTNVGILIDEGDKLFSYPERENSDALHTASAFNAWMRRMCDEKRRDVAFIITGNNPTHFAQHLLSRLAGRIYKFTGPKTAREKAEALAVYYNIKGDADVFIKNLTRVLSKFPSLSGRDLEKVYHLSKMYRDIRAKDELVSLDDIKDGCEKIIQERVDTKYDEHELSMQELAVKHHEESMRQAARQHAYSMGQSADQHRSNAVARLFS